MDMFPLQNTDTINAFTYKAAFALFRIVLLWGNFPNKSAMAQTPKTN